MLKLKTIAAAVGLMALPVMSQAATPTLSDVLKASGISVSGAVDFSYDWADTDGTAGRQLDVLNDSFSLHQVNLLVSKDFGSGLSATVNGVFGDDAAIIHGPGAGSTDYDTVQAFITYATGGLTVSGGRMTTLAGYEVINPAGNSTASRGLLFFNQPFVHTGVRANYKLSDTLNVTVGILNDAVGAGVAKVDNNSDKTLEAQVAFLPSSALAVYLTGYTGVIDAGVVAGQSPGLITQSFLDLVATFTVNDTLSVATNLDYGTTEDGAGGDVVYTAAAVYGTAKIMPKLAVTLRGEVTAVDDTVGGTTEAKSLTAVAGYSVTDAFTLMGELRNDTRDVNFYERNSSQAGVDSKYMNTATIKGVLKF